MTRRKETFDERVERLRTEPAFQALVASLRRQSGNQVDRFSEWCDRSDWEGKNNAEANKSESSTGS
jgi:hypothetical protein